MWLQHWRREARCLWWRQNFRLSTHPEKKKNINKGECRRGNSSSHHNLLYKFSQARDAFSVLAHQTAPHKHKRRRVSTGDGVDVTGTGSGEPRALPAQTWGWSVPLSQRRCESSQPLRIQIRDRSWPQCATHKSGGRTPGPVTPGTCLSILWARRWRRTVPGLAAARRNGVRSWKLW